MSLIEIIKEEFGPDVVITEVEDAGEQDTDGGCEHEADGDISG